MSCGNWETKLTNFAMDELTTAEQAELEAHLGNCESCRGELAEIRATTQMLRDELAGEPAPVLEESQREELLVRARPRLAPFGVSWNKAAMAAGALLAAGGLFFLFATGGYFQEFRVAQENTIPGTLLVSARPSQPEPTAADAESKEIAIAPIPVELTPDLLGEDEDGDAGFFLGHGSKEISGEGMGRASRKIQSEMKAKQPEQNRPSYGGAFGGRRNLVARKGQAGAAPVESQIGYLEIAEGVESFDETVPENENYRGSPENSFAKVKDRPLSTFSIDTDKASYANVRRFLNQGQLPPRGAVRIEELLNYFAYAYPQPAADEPFSVSLTTATSPWTPGNLLLRVGIQGREVAREKRPPCNLVFLVDVSGSMEAVNKLPLLQSCMKALVEDLREQDRVGIVTYAGEAGVALPSTSCEQKNKILGVLENLKAEGSTNGGAGIQQAYQMAAKHFLKGGVNRVILATDGDFNVGVTDDNDLAKLIGEKAKTGVFLTVLGFGMGNLKDARLEALADKGNGHYAYIDSFSEGRKTLVTEAGSALVAIAKDVKIQIEFNPQKIQAYRLIGYENRLLAAKDFNDDKKDAGEIGAGHRVTALYELVPVGRAYHVADVDPLKYQQPSDAAIELVPTEAAGNGELLTAKLRYKDPEGEASRLLVYTLEGEAPSFARADSELRFAAAVAAFGMILRDSPHKGDASFEKILAWAEAARGKDISGDRAEFVSLVRAAKSLKK